MYKKALTKIIMHILGIFYDAFTSYIIFKLTEKIIARQSLSKETVVGKTTSCGW